jgi:hypothetical protein
MPSFVQHRNGYRRRTSRLKAWCGVICLMAALPVTQSVAQTLPDAICLNSALSDYWQANATILKHLAPDNQFLSLEDQIGLRRFKEQYCLRYVQCIYGATPESNHVPSYRNAFFECLRDSQLDPQIALPNK